MNRVVYLTSNGVLFSNEENLMILLCALLVPSADIAKAEYLK